MLENGADPNVLTAENERPIDLVDQDNFPLISLLLNYMRLNDSSDNGNNDNDIENDNENLNGNQMDIDTNNNNINDNNNNNNTSNIISNKNDMNYIHQQICKLFELNLDNESLINEIEVS